MHQQTAQTTLDPTVWVDLYGDYLFSVACIQLNDREQAKDLVSDTFLSALQSLPAFRGEASEKTWLTKILRHKIIDYYRKKSGKHADLGDYLQETASSFYNSFFEVSGSSDAHWISTVSPTRDPKFSDHLVHTSDFERIIDYCLRKLPVKMRPIFIARFIDEQESEEICKEHAITSSNYWVVIHRTKLLMRKCLENNWIN
jgi:RNA polymerase sigma-70 factor (TIGR02943 family)